MSNLLFCTSVFLSLLLRAECLYSGDSCLSDGQPGVCTILSECEPILTEIKRSGMPMPIHLRIKLQKINCGYERDLPILCCVTTNTDSDSSNSPWSPTHGMGVVGSNQGEPALTNNPNWGSNTVGSDLNPGDKQTEKPIDSINRNNIKDGPIDIQGHPNLRLLPSSGCGIMEGDRIFGGTRTRLYEMPWMVLLSYDSARGTRLSCGGTLINEWYVLTAAHCVSFLGTRLTLASVILGEYDVRQDPDCERVEGEQFCAPNVRNVSIESVFAHPGYSPQTLFDDIALIRLSEPANFNLDSMKPICLPVSPELQTESLTGLNGTVAGWGAAEDGLQSPVLLSVQLPVVGNDECQAIYNGSPRIYKTQICAGGIPDKDSCGGDSGGPLMYSGTVGINGARYVQRGIVSFGSKRCGIGGYPGVYTRVAYYMKWILDHIQP